MGTIIGIGGGFSGDDELTLIRDIMTLTGRSRPRYLQIPTTGYDLADGHMLGTCYKMGCETDVLYLTHAYMTEEIMAQKIREADMIHVPGGNLQFTADKWKAAGADRYLKEAFERGKILFGSSSGSMCWFREGYDDCGPGDSFRFVEALGLLPYCNVPHYESAYWQSFNKDAHKTKLSTIACENETAICYTDGKWSLRISSARPDGRVWFFDAADGYKRLDLRQHPEILERM